MTEQTYTSRRRASTTVQPNQLLVEFEWEGHTYRVVKDREEFLRGDGRVIFPVESGLTTLEEDLFSGSVIAVNWARLAVLRIEVSDS